MEQTRNEGISLISSHDFIRNLPDSLAETSSSNTLQLFKSGLGTLQLFFLTRTIEKREIC